MQWYSEIYSSKQNCFICSIYHLQIQAYKLLPTVRTIYLTTLQGRYHGVQDTMTTPQPLT